MKKMMALLLATIVYKGNSVQAQLTIGTATHIKSNNDSYLVLDNLGLTHNAGTIEPVLKFAGSMDVFINSTGTPVFGRLMLAKSNGAAVKLLQPVEISEYIYFHSGLLDLNGHDINLQSSASLQNESENGRINSAAGGMVVINAQLNAPVAANPGNLGAVITSAANLGTVRIARGHVPFRMDAGNHYSIARYFTITPANNQNLNATLRLYYQDAELNGRTEGLLGIWRSDNGGSSFQPLEFTGRSTGENYVEQAGIHSFAIHTLFDAQAILPVTNLQFAARRISNDVVKLDWKTTQESNNRGFYLERRCEHETSFTQIGFIPSLAVNGNSTNPLGYSRNDYNNYTGNTYYRLKQEDLAGQQALSAVRMVTGDNSKTVVLKAWPIPAQGYFFVSIEGIEKDLLLIYDAAGKLQRQLPVSGYTQHQVSGLPAGMYVLRLASQKDIQQRVMTVRGRR